MHLLFCTGYGYRIKINTWDQTNTIGTKRAQRNPKTCPLDLRSKMKPPSDMCSRTCAKLPLSWLKEDRVGPPPSSPMAEKTTSCCCYILLFLLPWVIESFFQAGIWRTFWHLSYLLRSIMLRCCCGFVMAVAGVRVKVWKLLEGGSPPWRLEGNRYMRKTHWNLEHTSLIPGVCICLNN